MDPHVGRSQYEQNNRDRDRRRHAASVVFRPGDRITRAE
jgi:hypothetical protein